MADVDVTDAMGRTAVRGAMRETASGVDPEAAPDAARGRAEVAEARRTRPPGQVSRLKGLFDVNREARLVQPGDSYKVSVSILGRDPPSKHHPHEHATVSPARRRPCCPSTAR